MGRGLWMCAAAGTNARGDDLPGHRDPGDAGVPRALVGDQPTGTSALGLQRVLGLGSTARPRPGSISSAGRWCARSALWLTNTVEGDETFAGGVQPGGGNRHVGKKRRVVIAAELGGQAIGRIRLRRAADSSTDTLLSHPALSRARALPLMQQAVSAPF